WQLFGYGRSDRSTKLTRGLTSETAAGFRSRRGPSHDSTLVTPHNAPFPTYKAAPVHHAARRRGRVSARGARAADGNAGGRVFEQRVSQGLFAFPVCISNRSRRIRICRRQEREN